MTCVNDLASPQNALLFLIDDTKHKKLPIKKHTWPRLQMHQNLSTTKATTTATAKN
jgi:hypothetical protein